MDIAEQLPEASIEAYLRLMELNFGSWRPQSRRLAPQPSGGGPAERTAHDGAVLAYTALTRFPEPTIRRIPSPLTRAPQHRPFLALLLAATLAAATSAHADEPALADEPSQSPGPASDLSPAVVQGLTPVLADWYVRSRNAAVQQGVMEIPVSIRSALSGYVPEATLDRARWRVGAAESSVAAQRVRLRRRSRNHPRLRHRVR